MAIELVYLKSNTCVIHDEMLCHRLGLIPLNSVNVDNFIPKNECECSQKPGRRFCTQCSAKFMLNVKNEGEENLTITSKHLEWDSENVN